MRFIRSTQFLPPANEVWGKVIFSVPCVKNSVHSRGSASVHAGIPPLPEQAPPGSDTPWEQTPPGSRHPLPPLREQTSPLHSACWEVRSTSGRYASYWSALLCFNAIRNWFHAMNAVFQHKII